MNTKRTLLSLWVLLAYCTTLWAQLPTDGYAYRILSAAGDRAVTNADNGTAGAYLSMAAVDETSAGQLWTFYQVDNKDTYLVYNYTYGQAADMALTAAKSGVLLQCILGECATIEEVKEAVANIDIVNIDPRSSTVHWRFIDASGHQVVLEIVNRQAHFYDNPLGVFTNSPGFEWQLTKM